MRRRRPFWLGRLLPAFAALLTINLFVLATWTLPQGYKQKTATAQLRVARQELEEVRRSAARLRDRASAIRSNVADGERFYAKAAGSMAVDLVPTLEAIESMARSPGLKPGGRSISRGEVSATSLEQVKVTLALEGSYPQLVGFLREVETSKRFLTVDSISLWSRERGASLQVQLSAYMKASPGAARKRGGRARG
jgi:Tfp pilus assembly protein PilO